MLYAFISYPNPNDGIAENLRDRLAELGANAWLYSHNRTAGVGTWPEIELRLREATVILFLASEYSDQAKGQKRELDLAFQAIAKFKAAPRVVPIVIGDFPFSSLPEQLDRVNGFRIDHYNVKTVAHNIVVEFFPEALEPQENKWNCPAPGDWLRICNVDDQIEEHFGIGDFVYFRRLSPLGLFECYAPAINSLFWFHPSNVGRLSTPIERAPNIPRQYLAYDQFVT